MNDLQERKNRVTVNRSVDNIKKALKVLDDIRIGGNFIPQIDLLFSNTVNRIERYVEIINSPPKLYKENCPRCNDTGTHKVMIEMGKEPVEVNCEDCVKGAMKLYGESLIDASVINENKPDMQVVNE